MASVVVVVVRAFLVIFCCNCACAARPCVWTVVVATATPPAAFGVPPIDDNAAVIDGLPDWTSDLACAPACFGVTTDEPLFLIVMLTVAAEVRRRARKRDPRRRDAVAVTVALSSTVPGSASAAAILACVSSALSETLAAFAVIEDSSKAILLVSIVPGSIPTVWLPFFTFATMP